MLFRIQIHFHLFVQNYEEDDEPETITVYRFCLDRESDYLFAFDAISLFQIIFFFWRNEIISKNTNHQTENKMLN